MSTLELIWNSEKRYKMWSWKNGNVHYVAHFIRRIDKRDNVCTVRIGERGGPKVPKSNRDEDAAVGVVKLAFTPDASDALEREAQCYTQMESLQGVAVPRCLGHFRSKVAGAEMSCLVLDYCVGYPGDPMLDVRRRIMTAAYALHAQNVLHGDLLDGRHFVKSGRDVAIVDFAAAVPHKCVHGRRIHGPDGRTVIGSCPELAALERIYGVHTPA
ncbi:hypothetical protein R3P38DRAFT_3344302 [Favolaschia claudopus]|uniref:Protein kinase domain-containing protein n=1 Tax=Favolaschia claudopus TaxID=2862362 RepID=A0AAW0DLD0_9AGAR